MKTQITTDINNSIFEARREFDADIKIVWRAFTEAELLDEWWAPKPWKCETKSMDFHPGGKWIYFMVGPNGERHGGMQIFDEIKIHNYFSGIDAFTDNEGNIDDKLPVASWKNTFIKTENGTLVITKAKYPSKEALETVLNMGMAEGLNLAQNNLEELLKSIG